MDTKELMIEFRKEFIRTLDELERKYDLRIDTKTDDFCPNFGTFLIRINGMKKDNPIYTKEQFTKALDKMDDFSEEDFQKRLQTPQGTFEIIGLNPRNTKYKVVLRNICTHEVWEETVSRVLSYKNIQHQQMIPGK